MADAAPPLHLTIDGVTYDVSEWIKRHPGGAVLSAGVGVDATALFYSHHLGSTVFARAKAVLATLPRVEGAPPLRDCKHFIGEHYQELSAAAKKAVAQKDTTLLDWSVAVAGVCVLAWAILASRLRGSCAATVLLPLLARASDGFQHADGHGQPFRTPLFLRRLCTAFHYTFGQSPYGHGGHYYYYPAVQRPWATTHFGHHLETNTDKDLEYTTHYDFELSIGKVLSSLLLAPTLLAAAACAAFLHLDGGLYAPAWAAPAARALPYLIALLSHCRPYALKTAEVVRSLRSDTARPERPAVRLLAWLSHMLVGADGPGLLMWATCTPLQAALYPAVGACVFELLWTPVYGLSQHSLFNVVRSPADGLQRSEVSWDVQQVETSADCIPTGLAWVYSVLCMHADVYQATHHLLPAVHWAHMPTLQPIVARWCKEHGYAYSSVKDRAALADFYCGKWTRGLRLNAEQRRPQ